MITKLFNIYCKKNKIERFRVYPKEIQVGRKKKIIYVIQELYFGFLFNKWVEIPIPELSEKNNNREYMIGIVSHLNEIK